MHIHVAENVSLCTNNSEICDSLPWQIVHGILDIPCFLLNLLHLALILRMKSLRTNPCLRALYIHMALAGMLNGLVAFLRGNCFLMRNVSRQSSIVVMTVGMIFDWPGADKYYIVCCGSYERFISICKPMYKPTNIFLNNFNKSLTTLWFILFSLMMLFGVIWNDKSCLMGNSGPTLLFGLSNPFTLIAASFTWLPCVITTLFVSLVAAELRRMMRRSQPGQQRHHQNRDMIVATRCLMIIMVTMVLCLVPVCLCITLWGYEPTRHLIAGSTLSLFYLMFMSHGIFDTVVFGWMMPAFRREGMTLWVKMKNKICCLMKNSPRIVTDNSQSRSN